MTDSGTKCAWVIHESKAVQICVHNNRLCLYVSRVPGSVKNPHNNREIRGPAKSKKFCHWVQITSVLRFIKHIFITNLQNIPPLLKHIFVTFLPSREKQINSLLLVSVGDTDK